MQLIAIRSASNLITSKLISNHPIKTAIYMTAREALGVYTSYSLFTSNAIVKSLEKHQVKIVSAIAAQIKTRSYAPLKIIEMSVKHQYVKAIPKVNVLVCAILGFILVVTPNVFLATAIIRDDQDIENGHNTLTPRWEFSLKNIGRLACFSLYISSLAASYKMQSQTFRWSLS